MTFGSSVSPNQVSASRHPGLNSFFLELLLIFRNDLDAIRPLASAQQPGLQVHGSTRRQIAFS